MITVELGVDDVVDLYRLELHLRFNPSVLAAMQVLPGNLPDAREGFFVWNIDQVLGQIEYSMTLLDPAPAATGSGVATQIVFKGLAPGPSPLTLIEVTLVNQAGEPIPARRLERSITVRPWAAIAYFPLVVMNSTPPPAPAPTSTPTRTPTASPTPTPTWTPVSACREAVLNGSFENDLAEGWIIGGQYLPGRTSKAPRSGNWSLQLGIESIEADVYSSSAAWQTVDVPSDVTTATLSFSYWPGSYEGNVNLDKQMVLVMDGDVLPGKDSYKILMNIDEDARTWTNLSFDLLRELNFDPRGRHMHLYFTVLNDGKDRRPSWMKLDDVSLQLCRG